MTEAIRADTGTFDADVLGGGDRIRAEFDVLADDVPSAAADASRIFLRALGEAVEFGVPAENVWIERLSVEPARDREL